MGVSKKQAPLFGSPYEDPGIFEPVFGPLILGKPHMSAILILPYRGGLPKPREANKPPRLQPLCHNKAGLWKFERIQYSPDGPEKVLRSFAGA